MGNKIGVGIIGCGSRIRGLAKKLIQQYPEIEVVGFFAPRAEAIEEGRKTLNPDAEAYNDYHELVNDKRIDWVMIGSWNCYHKEQAVAAFEAGKMSFVKNRLPLPWRTVSQCARLGGKAVAGSVSGSFSAIHRITARSRNCLRPAQIGQS